MNFSWGEEDQAIFDKCVRFARARLRSADYEARRLWRDCGDIGLFDACVPTATTPLSGALRAARLMEALGYGAADMGAVFGLAAHTFACTVPAQLFCDNDVTRAIAERLRQGEAIGANAITEAGAGSDAFALEATARREGEHYVISAVKTYVTNAAVCDEILVYAKTEPDAGYLGISAFLVDRHSPGVKVGSPIEKMGLESASLASVMLEDCRVPVERRLGREGVGARIFTTSMQWERACLFGAYVGQMELQLEECVEYARERKQFGRAIGSNQAIAHKLANMKLRLEAARLLLYRAAWAIEQGEDATMSISLAKIAVAEAAVDSGLDAIQIFGGLGYVRDAAIEKRLRDAVAARIFSGTSEIQRDIVANSLSRSAR
ncbi:acyl-CoA dehydrogenase family protein [Pendulispora brunnea]|uniref:Acyl-CoA dehydrogenase family protein n=1 Tax=Pendulispora brunnea TaxID=2905690 RepID=A0ABZ2KKU9_9BACT